MALVGLKERQQFGDEASATVVALELLGLVDDRERLLDSVSTEFEVLRASGIPGELYIQVPESVCSACAIARAVWYGQLSARSLEDDPKYVTFESLRENVDPLWRPGHAAHSYTVSEVGNLTIPSSQDRKWAPHARLAVYDTENTKAHNGKGLLHFLNQPFDSERATAGQQTQLEAIATVAANERYRGHTLAPLNTSGLAMIALIRRVQGLPMPMKNDHRSPAEVLVDATLPRRIFDQDRSRVSVVGTLSMEDHKLLFGTWEGAPAPNIGVGISIAPAPRPWYRQLLVR
jgi:hypothetical protein